VKSNNLVVGINKAIDNFMQNDLSQMKTNAYRVASENACCL
jgi:hypothetical protein